MSFQALYVGSTGMVTHGTRMQNIGNNIANVSTVGYKTQDTHFANLISRDVPTGNAAATTGISQLGLGVGVGAIYTDYRNGGMMNGSDVTDLGISGKGFFSVVGPEDGLTHYTRAGNFRFNKDGYLVDPNGYRLQGQQITDGVNGATGDIQLQAGADGQFTVDPSATTEATVITNLGFDGSYSNSATHPMFSMFENWNGSAEPPLGSGLYGFNSPIKVYDSEGNQQTLNIYFDKADVSNAGGRDYFEFMITTDPAADGRAGIAGTSGAGLLMTGVMTFDSTGQIVDLAAYSYGGTGDIGSLSNWTPSAFTANGYPQLDATFASGASVSVGMNFGISGTGWTTAASGGGSAASVGTVVGNLPSLDGFGRNALATTMHTGSSVVSYMSQDGYAEGYLSNLEMDRDGVLIGNYTNGVQLELFQVTLYNFASEWGLRREGSNHFSATAASGEALEGYANEENYGGINSTSLEQSNVDIAEQFAKMILTERGFQANSKIITTTDEIIKNAIQMKR